MKINILKWIIFNDYDLDKIIILYLNESNDFYLDLHKYVFVNRFISKNQKNKIIDTIRIAQSNRFIITKFIKKLYWKINKKKICYKNDSDLMLNPFLKCNSYPYIIENFNIYRFSKTDVRNLFKNSLLYSKFRQITILPIKNPYNNRIISNFELYNLYIQCYENRYMPWIIKEFAKVDFDKDIFKRNFRSYLDLKATHIDLKDFPDNELLKEADHCFKSNLVNYLNYNMFYFSKYKYNGLKNIPIETIRLFFNPILIDNYFNNSIKNFKDEHYKLDHKYKKNLVKFWSLYPWILTNKSSTKSEHKIFEKILINKFLNTDNYHENYFSDNEYDYVE